MSRWPCPNCGAYPFFAGRAEPETCPFCGDGDGDCEECGGATVEFRFAGKNTQYKLCSRWREPGHLSESEWRGKIQSARLAALPPSGRSA